MSVDLLYEPRSYDRAMNDIHYEYLLLTFLAQFALRSFLFTESKYKTKRRYTRVEQHYTLSTPGTELSRDQFT